MIRRIFRLLRKLGIISDGIDDWKFMADHWDELSPEGREKIIAFAVRMKANNKKRFDKTIDGIIKEIREDYPSESQRYWLDYIKQKFEEAEKP